MNNWSDYKNWISESIKTGSQFYFRGQKNPAWKLQTSFHRFSKNAGVTLTDYLERIVPEVHYNVCSAQNELLDISTEQGVGGFLARLQHHGFPTPLLDWTLSPYIAAYFALKDVDPMNPGVDNVGIYIFDYKLWSMVYDLELNFQRKESFFTPFRPFANNNPRMLTQLAVTTATNVQDLENYLMNQTQNHPTPYLYKVILPINERKLIMNELNLMGINSMTMFPGLDGICSSMKEQYFNNIEVVPRIPVPPPPPPRS